MKISYKQYKSIDRFPARPYIRENYPKNATVLVNTTVTFECPTISDLAAHIEWAKIHIRNESDIDAFNKVQKLEVILL